MALRCAKDKTTQMAEQNQIRQSWHVFFYVLLSGYLMTETANLIPTSLRTKLKRLHRESNSLGHSASALSAAICCCLLLPGIQIFQPLHREMPLMLE